MGGERGFLDDLLCLKTNDFTNAAKSEVCNLMGHILLTWSAGGEGGWLGPPWILIISEDTLPHTHRTLSLHYRPLPHFPPFPIPCFPLWR